MNKIERFFDDIAEEYDNGKVKNYQLIDSLISDIEIKIGDNVLDLGCGKGVISERLYDHSKRKVIAMDLSERMIHFAKKGRINPEKVVFIKDDFYTTRERGFDQIVLFDCYPHFLDIERFKAKCQEVLNEKGKISIIHDISRDYLNHCHSGISSISRTLLPVTEEAKPYLDVFDIMKAKETDQSYLLILRKKK